jgi:photosystem II stability/assembly factor-like uncharacterized protein
MASTIVESGLIASGFGWAMNGIGLWLTQNGGARWRAVAPPHVLAIGDPAARINQIQFIDKRHGWISASDVVGGVVPPGGASLRHMEIDRTQDGGRTWQWSIPPGCAALCGGAHISFLDAEHGYALTGITPQPRLYKSSDGGATWKLISHPPFSGAIVFVNRRKAFGISDPSRMTGPTQNVPVGGGVLYRTTDGGDQWRAVRLVSPARYAGQHATADPPRFFGRRSGVVSVRFRDQASGAQHVVVYVTEDGGRNWSPRLVPTSADLRAYTWGFPNATPFSAASANVWKLLVGRTLYATADAGRTWAVVHPTYAPRAPRVWDVNFTSRSQGWAIFAVRAGAALVQTRNSGRDWRALAPPVPKLRPVHSWPACGSACRRP